MGYFFADSRVYPSYDGGISQLFGKHSVWPLPKSIKCDKGIMVKRKYGRETYIGEVPMMLDFRSNLALITITEDIKDTRANPAIPTGLIGIIRFIEQAGFSDKGSPICGGGISGLRGNDSYVTYQTSQFFNLPNQSLARGLIGDFLYIPDFSKRML